MHPALREQPDTGAQVLVRQGLGPLDEGAGALDGQDLVGDVGEIAAEMHRAFQAEDRALARLDAELAELLLVRSEEHTSELQSLMRISYAVFCLKKKKKKQSTSVIKTINQVFNKTKIR